MRPRVSRGAWIAVALFAVVAAGTYGVMWFMVRGIFGGAPEGARAS